MNCRDAVRTIEARLDGAAEEAERRDLEGHLAECPACRRELDERRAFADQVGRSIYHSLRAVVPMPGLKQDCLRALDDQAAPPRRTLRLPWKPFAGAAALAAGVLVVLFAGGFLESAPSAEARELAERRARRDRLAAEVVRCADEVRGAATRLDAKVDAAPAGAVRDAASIWLASTAARLAAAGPEAVPEDPRARVGALSRQLSDRDLGVRGRAVWGFQQLGRPHAPALREAVAGMEGAPRAFAELVLQSIEPEDRPAIDVTVSVDEIEVQVLQFGDGRVKLLHRSGGETQALEARSIAEFRAQHPKLAGQLAIVGVDGDFSVAGLRQRAPARPRPVMYLEEAVWGPVTARQEGTFLKLASESLVLDYLRDGAAPTEAEQRAVAVLRQLGSSGPAPVPTPEAAHVKRLAAELKRLDAAALALERRRVDDELPILEGRWRELVRQLDTLRKAEATLDARKAK